LKAHLDNPISFQKQFNNLINPEIINMLFTSAFAICTALLGATFSVAQSTPSAPVITDNTPGQWVIINPNSWYGDKSFVGQISAAANPSGGVIMTINLNGGSAGSIPGGPFCK
jgi:hypothetical protein